MRYRDAQNLENDLLVFDVETVLHEWVNVAPGENIVAPSKQRPIVVGMADVQISYSSGGPFYCLKKVVSVAGSSGEVTESFFNEVRERKPRLVSFNGKGFDIPTLKIAALEHGLDISAYMETGRSKWDSYESHYDRQYHFDCMDVIAGRGRYPKLDDIASRLGIPAKMGIDGSQVQEHHDRGNINLIKDYCSFDVLTTFLLFLQLQRSFGGLSEAGLIKSKAAVREYLEENAEENSHFNDYLMALDNPKCKKSALEDKVINLEERKLQIDVAQEDLF